MEVKQFLVKDESVKAFFIEHSLEDVAERFRREPMSPYYFFKDEIFLKKDSLNGNSVALFELKDITRGSEKQLINRYVYEVSPYDDVSVKLSLIAFEIKPL